MQDATIANPDLEMAGVKPRWDCAADRRQGFHDLHRIAP